MNDMPPERYVGYGSQCMVFNLGTSGFKTCYYFLPVINFPEHQFPQVIRIPNSFTDIELKHTDLI